jgi:drug/metabolite transporter (DMT)-like permease
MKKSNISQLYLAYFSLAFGILCIGFSAIFVKMANVPGSVSTFYRVFIALIILIPIWLYRGTKVPRARDLWLILIGAVFFAIDLFLWNTSLLLTSAATATLLANNAPIWVGLISLVVFREKLAPRFWYGLLMAVLGLNVLIGLHGWLSLSFNRGDLMALSASFFYALYLLLTLDSRKRVDTVTFMTFSVLFMAIMLFIANVVSGNPLIGYSQKTWLSLMGLGVITHFGGWITINYALGYLKAENISVTLLSQSVITSLLAIPILGEVLSWSQVIGGVLILAGIYVVNRRRTLK